MSVQTIIPWVSLGLVGHGSRRSYDPLDNLRSNQLGASVLAYSYDSSNRLTQLANGVGSQWTVSSDTRGNVVANAMRNQAYQFDLAHRMNAVTNQESYFYDGHGRRVRTLNLVTGSIEYFGYGKDGRLLQDWSNRRQVRNGYIYLGNTLVGLYEVNLGTGAVTPKYQHTDALGSPVVTTHANKTVLSRMGYTPYGAPTLPMDGVGYTGHFIDVGTQLTYMQQRYYDLQLGRFLSADPVPTSLATGSNFNRFWYANGNPFRFVDPDGRASKGWRDQLSDAIGKMFGSKGDNGDTRKGAEQMGKTAAAEVPGKSDFAAGAESLAGTVAAAASPAKDAVTTLAVCAFAAVVGLDAESVAANGAKAAGTKGMEDIVEKNGAKEMGEAGLGWFVKMVPLVKAVNAVNDLDTFATCSAERTHAAARREANSR